MPDRHMILMEKTFDKLELEMKKWVSLGWKPDDAIPISIAEIEGQPVWVLVIIAPDTAKTP
jgi:hypothetical protein